MLTLTLLVVSYTADYKGRNFSPGPGWFIISCLLDWIGFFVTLGRVV